MEENTMAKSKFPSFEFFNSFHDKDNFYERIVNEKNVLSEILNHLVLLILFGAVYGIVMGSYNGFYQAISSGIKVPLLFILIIIICFPAFYVIQTILGSKLTFGQIISVVLLGFVLTNAILVAFAPIVLFFMITGDNYSFLKLLHVGIFIIGGFFGMRAIVEALKFSCEKKNIYPKTGVQVFRFWILILAFVGAQLSWSLRPFVGAKDMDFEIFRQRGGNFYVEIIHSTVDILDPGWREREQRQKARRNPTRNEEKIEQNNAPATETPPNSSK
jgi:hypothetical protein